MRLRITRPGRPYGARVPNPEPNGGVEALQLAYRL